MTGEQMWSAFTERADVTGKNYSAWSFGMDADHLAELVRNGTKTATSSAHPLYEVEQEPIPAEGEYSVILNEQKSRLHHSNDKGFYHRFF